MIALRALAQRTPLALRAFPTLLAIGFAESLAYRTELLVWMLATTAPLVNLVLWNAVTARSAVAGWGQPEVSAYFAVVFVVRQVTGAWVVWVMNAELRSGAFSMRLLRPIHPLWAYAADNLAALPLRGALSLPLAAIVLFAACGYALTSDPVLWLCAGAALFLAWLVTFLSMTLLGVCGFFIEQSTSLVLVYWSAFYALSGYLFPLDFLGPRLPGLVAALHHLPPYFQLGFPIELTLGRLDRATALGGLLESAAWALGLLALTLAAFRAGLRRWNAYGA